MCLGECVVMLLSLSVDKTKMAAQYVMKCSDICVTQFLGTQRYEL